MQLSSHFPFQEASFSVGEIAWKISRFDQHVGAPGRLWQGVKCRGGHGGHPVEQVELLSQGCNVVEDSQQRLLSHLSLTEPLSSSLTRSSTCDNKRLVDFWAGYANVRALNLGGNS